MSYGATVLDNKKYTRLGRIDNVFKSNLFLLLSLITLRLKGNNVDKEFARILSIILVVLTQLLITVTFILQKCNNTFCLIGFIFQILKYS